MVAGVMAPSPQGDRQEWKCRSKAAFMAGIPFLSRFRRRELAGQSSCFSAAAVS